LNTPTVSQKPFRYTGKERDDGTGLYYYGARYYAPWLGRWTAADPVGIKDGPCVFAYVKNNPVRYNDSTGNIRVDATGVPNTKYDSNSPTGSLISAAAT